MYIPIKKLVGAFNEGSGWDEIKEHGMDYVDPYFSILCAIEHLYLNLAGEPELPIDTDIDKVHSDVHSALHKIAPWAIEPPNNIPEEDSTELIKWVNKNILKTISVDCSTTEISIRILTAIAAINPKAVIAIQLASD